MKSDSYAHFSERKWKLSGLSRVGDRSQKRSQDLSPDDFSMTFHCFPNKPWPGNWNTWASSGHDGWDTIVGKGSILKAKAFLTDLHFHFTLEKEGVYWGCVWAIPGLLSFRTLRTSAWMTSRCLFLLQGNINSIQIYAAETVPPTLVVLRSQLIASLFT